MATHVMLILMYIIQIIGIVIVAALGGSAEMEGEVFHSFITTFIIIGIVIALNILALVFSGLFTWGCSYMVV